MKDIYILGAGGLAKDINWLIERINQVNGEKIWNMRGYVDEEREADLLKCTSNIHVICAVGNPRLRKNIIEKFICRKNIEFPNLIDPSVIMSDKITLGKGNVICAGNILTVDISINDFNIINYDCTLGHDSVIDSYVTLYPSVNVSGNVKIGSLTEVGTGSHIIQELIIGERTIIGAGTVVIRDIPGNCTVVGNPSKIIKNGICKSGKDKDLC